MKIKVYVVRLKEDTETSHIWYMVDAPNKRIAKWSGANLYNHEYSTFKTAKDMKVRKAKFNYA